MNRLFPPTHLIRADDKKGFTLIELLIVIAIIAILAVVVVLVLNPAELLKESRDSNRLSDMQTLTNAINLYNADQSGASNFSLGSSSIVYTSLIDTSSTCGNQVLPALPSGYSYFCGSSTSSRNIDGTGWVPIDFKSISSGAPIGSLPLDPVDQSSTGLYYTYATDGAHFEVTSIFESQKYKANQVKNPPDALYPELDAQGSSLSVNPLYNPSGLVGWWPLDEGSGAIATDQSGNGNDGNWNGTAAGTNGYYSPGHVSSWAGAFATTSANYVDTHDVSGLLNLSQPMTITAWIYQSGGSLMGVAGDYAVWQGCGYNLGVNGDTAEFGINYPGVGVYPTASIPANQWVFLAGVFTGSQAILYVNGAYASSTNVSQLGACGTNDFYIGRVVQASWGSFTGLINDVRVYNRPLMSAEIQAIYSAEN